MPRVQHAAGRAFICLHTLVPSEQQSACMHCHIAIRLLSAACSGRRFWILIPIRTLCWDGVCPSSGRSSRSGGCYQFMFCPTTKLTVLVVAQQGFACGLPPTQHQRGQPACTCLEHTPASVAAAQQVPACPPCCAVLLSQLWSVLAHSLGNWLRHPCLVPPLISMQGDLLHGERHDR